MNTDLGKRKNLGRGLSALFGEQEPEAAPAPSGPPAPAVVTAPVGTPITRLALDLLMPSALQPRRHFDETALEELSASIAKKGVLQPLLVRPDPSAPGRYEIIAGERRWRASQR